MMLTEMWCPQCKQTKQVGVVAGHFPQVCGECQLANEAKKKAEWLAQFDGLTPEQAVKKLAEMFYDGQKAQAERLTWRDMRF